MGAGAEAVFARKRTDRGVEYTVTPASVSGGFTATAGVLGVAISGTLAIQTFNTRGVTSIACAVGAVVVALLLFFKIRDERAARRSPTILTITKSSLTVGGREYPLDDISELFILDPNGQPSGRAAVFVGGEGVAGGVAAGASVGVGAALAAIDSAVASQAARSLSLALRKRSHSKSEAICTGLTADTGVALLNDISETIRTI